MKLPFEHYTRKIVLSVIFTQHVIFRGARYVSSVANLQLIEINNLFKYLGGVDKLKVSTLRERRYLENVRKRTRGRGSKNR